MWPAKLAQDLRSDKALPAGAVKEQPTVANRAVHYRVSARRVLAASLGRFGVLVVLVGIFVIFSILRPATFPTKMNVQTMAEIEAVSAILAGAVLIPLVVGEFDLSVGNVLGFAGILVVKLDSLPLPLDILAVFLLGAAIGLLNGLIVTKLHVNSFIATLGSSTAIGGLSLAFSGGQVLFNGLPRALFTLGRTSVAGVNLGSIYAIVILAVIWYVLNHMPVGRQMYGIGGNRTVALLSGVRVGKLTCGCFVFSGLISSIAGVIEVAQIGSADPTFGPNFLLPAFASVFLGATTIKPGIPNVLGVVVAVTLLTVITSGLGQLGAPDWVEPVFDGMVLICAVALSLFVLRRSDRSGARMPGFGG